MSSSGEALEAWGATSTPNAPVRAAGRWAVLGVAAVLWLFAAWPLFLVETLPHQDLSAHAAAAYVADHISQYPEYVAAHGFRTNSAFTMFVSGAAPWLGYLGAGRVFLLAVLAVNALGYTLLLESLGGTKRVWIGGLFAVPFVHHWFVSMGMLNFSLSFGLCLSILSQQKALRERWSYTRAAVVLGLSVLAWVAHNFPLFVLLLMASSECVHALVRERSSLTGTLRWMVALMPAGLLVVVGTVLAPVHEYARIPGIARTVWENPGDLILGMFRHFVLGPSNWSSAGIVSALTLMLVCVIYRKAPNPPGFAAATLVVMGLCYIFVPISVIPVWSYFGTRFVPFIWLALLVRVPEQLPPRVVQLLCCSAVASSIGSGAGFLRMSDQLQDFRSGVPSVPQGAKVLPLLFTVNTPGDYIEPFTHAWAHYTLERGTSADIVWASRSVDAEHYLNVPPPEFQHDAVAVQGRVMYSANVWCSRLVRSAGTLLADCPATWEAEWHHYLKEAARRYQYVLVWDVPEATLAVIDQHFQIVHRQGKLIVGKLTQ